jgi:repressor LexA
MPPVMAAEPPLNPKARMVLGFLESYQAEHGYPPTVREIGAGCGIPSTRSVSDHLKALERAGRIRRRGYRSRGIELVGRDGPGRRPGVPVLGRIAAGGPLAAEAHDAGTLEVDPERLFGQDGCFALQVKGESMVGRHILPGDYVVVRPQPVAGPGDVVAVSVDGEVTLKVYREDPDGQRIVLMPANPEYEPIVLDAATENVRILGVMVGLVRRGAGP